MMRRLFFTIKMLSLAGVIIAMYLLWQQWIQSSFRPCSINATINCDAIISGAVAKTFGIPTPLYGLIGYFIIFLASIYRKKRLLVGAATFGLVFCLWIAYKELFELRIICPICIVCQFIMITIFCLAIVATKKHTNNS